MFFNQSMSNITFSDHLLHGQRVIAEIKDLCVRFPVTAYEQRDIFTNALFLKSQAFKPILLALNESLQNEADKKRIQVLEQDFHQAMSDAVSHCEKIRTPPQAFVTNIQEQIMALIRADDAVNLNKFVHNMSSEKALDHINYGLRNAAFMGKIQCVKVLCGPFPKRATGDIFAKGMPSGKIAMHRAIEAGHANCVQELLNTMSTLDGLAPVAQLLYGDAPNRPIDSLKNLRNNEQCINICNVILANDLKDYYSDSNELKNKVIHIVRQIRDERLEAQEAALSSTYTY